MLRISRNQNRKQNRNQSRTRVARAFLKLSRWVSPTIILVALTIPAFASLEQAGNPSTATDAYGLIYRDEQSQHTALLLHTDVRMSVNGLINRVTVKQTFTNPSDNWISGHYRFPLPENAAADQLRLWIGERYIEGEIQPKQKAQAQYQQAKSAGKKATLVAQDRPNIFSTSVANIAPHERVTVEIEYQQSIDYDDNEFNLRFPAVINPRYTPNSHHGAKTNNTMRKHAASSPQSSAQTPPPSLPPSLTETPMLSGGWGIIGHTVDDEMLQVTATHQPRTVPNIPFNLLVDLDAGQPISHIESSGYSTKKSRITDQHYQLSLDSPAIADRDFVLNWQLEATQQPNAALFQQHHSTNDTHYGLMMLMPPQSESFNAIPQHMTFVFDISGSMFGESMTQAKQALQYGLTRLSTTDYFNIIIFNHEAYRYTHEPQPANEKNVAQAMDFISGLEANGGTEMAKALTLAFEEPTYRDVLNQVVFITDGSVTNEEQLFKQIIRERGEKRLFTVGIGSAPNSYFMRRAAIAGKGTYTYVNQTKDIVKPIGQLFDRISAPAMRDIQLRWDSGEPVDFWPNPLPDLYLNQPIHVAFSIPDGAKSINITGKTQASTLSEPWTQKVILADVHREATGINVLWARNQIDSIELSPSLSATEKQQQILQLGLEHHLVTAHTSLIAVDKTPSKPEFEDAMDKTISPHLPAGSSAQLVGSTMAQTGNNSAIFIFLGSLFSLFSIVTIRVAQKAVKLSM